MRAVVLVFVGGMLGTAARLGLDALLPHTDTGFPASTLLINVVGSLALGFLVAGVWPTVSAPLRAALGPGVLGSFTTFSAVVVSLTTLAVDGQELLALLYLALSLLLGFGAAALGLFLGARFANRRSPRGTP
ncbi:MAG: hypothetical protein JWQ43_3808, partial [Glaciihabitans sp.]|nr:hypothetical protein [Glaciihabitans sp.]